MRDSVVFYRSFWDAIRHLPASDQLAALTAIVEYGLDGVEPEPSGVAYAIFVMAKPQIDRGIHFLDGQNGRHCAEYNAWRKMVFERDAYICQKCGRRGGKLNAHHIKKYSLFPEVRYDLENGITLCEKCHKEVHKHEK